MLHILEDNEPVIKMIIKGRSPTMRDVSRTHRVAHDWFFDRINLDPVIQIKYVDTKNQLADILTEWNNLFRLFNISHFSLLCCSHDFCLTSCSKTITLSSPARRFKSATSEDAPIHSQTLANPTTSIEEKRDLSVNGKSWGWNVNNNWSQSSSSSSSTWWRPQEWRRNYKNGKNGSFYMRNLFKVKIIIFLRDTYTFVVYLFFKEFAYRQ